jgi:hypothetical protein
MVIVATRIQLAFYMDRTSETEPYNITHVPGVRLLQIRLIQNHILPPAVIYTSKWRDLLHENIPPTILRRAQDPHGYSRVFVYKQARA